MALRPHLSMGLPFSMRESAANCYTIDTLSRVPFRGQ